MCHCLLSEHSVSVSIICTPDCESGSWVSHLSKLVSWMNWPWGSDTNYWSMHNNCIGWASWLCQIELTIWECSQCWLLNWGCISRSVATSWTVWNIKFPVTQVEVICWVNIATGLSKLLVVLWSIPLSWSLLNIIFRLRLLLSVLRTILVWSTKPCGCCIIIWSWLLRWFSKFDSWSWSCNSSKDQSRSVEFH